MSAASGWEQDHLLACRVIIRPQRPNILPILSKYSKSSDTTSSAEIARFLKGPDSDMHFQRSEHSLVRDFGYSISLAQTWSALGAFEGDRDADRTSYAVVPSNSEHSDTDSDDADSDVPMDTEFDGGRITRTTARGAREESSKPIAPSVFVPSGTMHVDSSSPRPPSSSDASSAGYIEKKEHQLRATVEDEPLRLASCVIRHILYFGAPQEQPDMSKIVEFRDVKLRTRAVVRGKKITAIDDGGLCVRLENNANQFILRNDHVAILEAKGKFQCLEEGKPIISDKCLAQMTCEALLARLVGFVADRETVIVIHATQHYLCFLQFEISDEYIEDFG